jgi:DNA invertase Pin-like site-specific DNA recombinase
MSAYWGRNAAEGALAAFHVAVREGIVPKGSFLVVESLDRISRQTVRRAVRTLEDIVEAGINLVDLEDNGRVYNIATLDNNDMAFLIMAIRFMRANQESVLKGDRVRRAYDNKRKWAAARGQTATPFTRKLPAWLYWDETASEIRAHGERAEIVRDIFQRTCEGWGQHKIAKWLNERQVPTWGDAERWHRSYVAKILANSAVVGTFTPHHRLRDETTGKRRRKPLDAIAGYFPAVVDEAAFNQVSLRMSTPAPRGRHADTGPRSAFRGVLRCSRCGGLVSRISKGEQAYLVCARANSKAACKYEAVRYHEVEDTLRRHAAEIVDRAPRGQETEAMDRDIENLSVFVDHLNSEVIEIGTELIHRKTETMRRMLREVEDRLEQTEERLRTLRATRDTLTAAHVLRRLQALQQALERDPFDVVEVNDALKQAVRKLVMDLEGATPAIHWHHVPEDEEPQAIFLPSRHMKVFETADDSVTTSTMKRGGR